MTMYQHGFVESETFDYPLGKIVCVGRNYAEHALELNNPIPEEPILFIKPSTAAVSMADPLLISQAAGSCHFETEIAILIGKPLTRAAQDQSKEAIAGVGLAFDLTLRDVQNRLKENGHPWEKAKAFDGSCPLSAFVSPARIDDWSNIRITLHKNSVLCQDDISGSMITPIFPLLSYISEHFTLLPGDVVLTGTPKGVGELCSGDNLSVALGDLLSVSTSVESVS